MAVVAGGSGSGNTTAPADDPGFANVGVRGGASAVYLGDGWVLTATHVGGGDTVFGGVTYNAVANSSIQLVNPVGVTYTTMSDLTLYKIDGRPPIAALEIEDNAPAVGWSVVMVGNGRDRLPTQNYWTAAWAPSATPSYYTGYTWAATQSVRWGTNTVTSVGVPVGVGQNSNVAFVTTFTGNTTSDAQGASGDSGGAVFHKDATGEWSLSGVMFATNRYTSQPSNTSVFGNATFSADLSAYRTQILSYIGVNDAPNGTNKTVSILQDTSYTFGVSDFGFTDPLDATPNTLLSVRISTLPTAGTLRLDNQAVTFGQYVSAADINAGKLRYSPPAGSLGAPYASFTFQVRDNGGTKNGGIDLDQWPNTMTLNVIRPNIAPSGANKAVIISAGAFAVRTMDFGFSDAADSTRNSFLAAKITQLPAQGMLALGGVPVTLGQSISAADIASELLTFTPGVVVVGLKYAVIGFQVQDDGGTAFAGADLDPTPNTITFNVTVADLIPPTVLSIVPVNGATNVFTSASVGIKFSEALLASSVNSTTIKLSDGATQVSASVSYDALTRTVTLTPTTSLALSKTYTVTVLGGANGVKDLSSNALLTNFAATLTTRANEQVFQLFSILDVPEIVDIGIDIPLNMGVTFYADVDGSVTGLRFYKSQLNLGVHTASIWSSSGVLLASATFTNETASGWQQVNFSTPVAIIAGQSYIASYFASQGHTSITPDYFVEGRDSGPLHVLPEGGVFNFNPVNSVPTESIDAGNPWVDVLFSPNEHYDGAGYALKDLAPAQPAPLEVAVPSVAPVEARVDAVVAALVVTDEAARHISPRARHEDPSANGLRHADALRRSIVDHVIQGLPRRRWW